MTTRRSDHRREGRYVNGGSTTATGGRLGWWERRIFKESYTDVSLTISKKYVGRPDLLAYDVYGRANLQWFILQYNNISDVNVEFVEGKVLKLPTASRLFGEMLTKTVT